jgi:predicted enzyme related to lactoylglutathione lyase
MIKFSAVLIGVNNLNKAKSFYEKVFEMVFDEFRPPFASAILNGVEFNIEEDAEYRSKDWARINIGGRKHISFEVDDLNIFLKHATNYGATIVQNPQKTPWNWLEAIVADPDGNEFIIEQKLI